MTNTRGVNWPVSFGIGAALGYYLDPERGKRRRRHLKDRVIHLGRVSKVGTKKAVVDAENRILGVVAEARARTVTEEQVADEVLLERVRAHLGHVVTHPRAIEVEVEDGRITLSGPTLESEAEPLLREIRLIPGVKEVVDELDRFVSAGGVPALQGGREPRAHRFIGSEWTPAYRMLGVAASIPLLGYALGQRGVSGGILGGVGAGLLARSLTNLPLNKLIGVGAGADVVEVKKHVYVDANPEEIFSQLQSPSNLKQLFKQIESISRATDGTSWEVLSRGPLGLPLSWRLQITEVEPNERITWKSVPGSRYPMEGSLRLTAAGDSGTNLDLELWYNPPGGRLGDAAASLVGSSLVHYLNQDLPRLQRFLARPIRDEGAEAPTRSDPAPAHGEGEAASSAPPSN